MSKRQRTFLEAWTELRIEIIKRDGWRCVHCGAHLQETPLEVHHVVKRSHDKALRLDPNNLITLCRRDHARTDAPYSEGRLVITPHGAGRFTTGIVMKPDKWAS